MTTCTEAVVSKKAFQTGGYISNEFFSVLRGQSSSQSESIATLINTTQAMCLSQTLSHTPNSDMSSSIATEAINPIREWGGEKQYDNSERPAVIMVFMKRWNRVQTKSVAPGKINSLALRHDPCPSWGYSKHTKTLLLFSSVKSEGMKCIDCLWLLTRLR